MARQEELRQRAFPYSRARSVRKRRALFFIRTDWTAASTRCSRSSRTPSTGARGARRDHHAHALRRRQRWRTTGAAVPWTGTPGKALQHRACVLRALRRRQVQLDGDSYEYSLGLNGLGACAASASPWMLTVWRSGELNIPCTLSAGRSPAKRRGAEDRKPTDRGQRTGTLTRWLPDLDVFTDINICVVFYRRAAPSGGRERGHRSASATRWAANSRCKEFLYESGIVDYVTELGGRGRAYAVFWETERRGPRG